MINIYTSYKMMLSPAYQQLLQRKGIGGGIKLAKPQYITDINRGGLGASVGNQQTAVREQGFGTHFKDAPPPFIETNKDNKIERRNKPKTKKNKKRGKRISK